MLARVALSGGMRIGLSALIAVIAALLVWGLLSDSGSNTNNLSRPEGPGASPASAGSVGTGGAVKTPSEAPVETLRQRSLR